MTERFALPPSLADTRNYVDGAFVSTGQTFDNVSPLTGRVLARVHEADAALRRHIQGREGTEWLFPWTDRRGCTRHHEREWLTLNVRRICRLAGVSEVFWAWVNLTRNLHLSSHPA